MIDICKVTKNYGFGDVFSNISFSVNIGDRIALVGKNGCGKSTLLKMIVGKENFNGQIIIGRNLSIGYLEQTYADQFDDRIVIDILKESFAKLYEEQKYLEELENKMTRLTGADLEKLVIKYSDFQEKFVEKGGYDIDNTINYVVNGLKIDRRILSQNYNTLSGGEKTIVHFAKILLDNPDVLLLDEPTNHLDIDRIEWLEGYLHRFKGALVVVSHDRYFLDKISNIVIDLEDGGERYVGNYSHFVKEKENKQLKEFEQYKNEQKKIEELKKAVKRIYEWASRSDNPSMYRRAKAIQRRIDEMLENQIDKPKDRKTLNINFKDTERSGNEVVKINNFSLILGDKLLFEGASLDIRQKDKVALIGKNGTGKSSLIKCIMGEYSDYDGVIKVGPSVSIGYLPQLLTFDNESQTILDYITSHTILKEQQARSSLAKFDFYKEDVDKIISNLSGGEKIRIKLACLLENKVNTLIFDEPTNHIDIFTRETLEESLKAFKGTIIFVSHDRYFINSVANSILEIQDGKLNMYRGNYDDYKHKDDIVEIKQEKIMKVKQPRISKGGKW